MSEIIELTDTSRLRIETDASPECPRGDWSMITGFVKIPLAGDSRLMDVPAVHEPPLPIRDAMDHFDFQAAGTAETEDIVARWAWIFHGLVLDYDAEHGGFWFCDPTQLRLNFPRIGETGMVHRFRQVEGAPPATYENYEQSDRECQAEVIAQEQETYRQWAQGEVYGVILERAAIWHRLNPDGTAAENPETRVTWEEAESVWDCYLSDTYTALDVAREWDLTDEEQAAIEEKSA